MIHWRSDPNEGILPAKPMIIHLRHCLCFELISRWTKINSSFDSLSFKSCFWDHRILNFFSEKKLYKPNSSQLSRVERWKLYFSDRFCFALAPFSIFHWNHRYLIGRDGLFVGVQFTDSQLKTYRFLLVELSLLTIWFDLPCHHSLVTILFLTFG